ncbi:unnamed protein product [Darwinula stevensoni]|uniref:NADH dehydrogenase [ubiquinone] 1 subunit C2 n=1 Tax=Darwinula stevensoni TaxID=69355 RepID=A0A7R8XE13_9CRUS|nr:unnamed protein product [Darwinula stevensoni]CAG0887317.1 unnamed protein product [Darwinula stevensoni]
MEHSEDGKAFRPFSPYYADDMADTFVEASKRYKLSVIGEYWSPVTCGLGGFGGVVLRNLFIKRPMLSGIQLHILAATVGALVGKYADNMYRKQTAQRDAIYTHYMHLHPERFPKPERKTFGEIFESWNPAR